MLSLQVLEVAILLLGKLLKPVNFHLADIDLVLVLFDLNFDLLVCLFLRIGDTVELDRHLFDLFGLCMVDVRLSGYILVALFDLELSALELLSHVTFGLLGLCQLDFDVAERVFQLLVFNLAQP